MTSRPAPASFRDLALAHAVQAIEAGGALDDAGEMALAHARHTSDQGRLLERARLLAQRLGLVDDWERLRTGLWVAGGLLGVLAFLLAGGLLTRALGSGQTVNAAFAFVAMLGVPVAALLVWMLWALGSVGSSSAAGPFSLGKLALGLAARLPGLRGPHSLNLLRGVHAVLREHRLGLWVFGALSHLLWALAFVLVLITLLMLFAFQSYSLTWETTILSPAFFEGFLQVTGWLPRALGFPVPDAVTVNAPPSANGAHAMAWWLLASALLYGLVPRLLALAVCALVWRQRAARLSIDASDPYFRQLLTRFQGMDPPQVVDAEHPPLLPQDPQAFRSRAPGEAVGSALIGFELPPESVWPPTALAAQSEAVHTVAGSMPERLQLLTTLATAPAVDAIFVCAAAASPDRGAERFLRQLCTHTHRCALLPLGSGPGGECTEGDKPGRWSDWLSASGLSAVHFCATPADASHWLASDTATQPPGTA
ncbi:MAG TPA: DUF2868 domain-containing protein [Hydrogenophaga sp.]|nr:DUF2868 domain-containing protein [Hydrogenophaga sp.]